MMKSNNNKAILNTCHFLFYGVVLLSYEFVEWSKRVSKMSLRYQQTGYHKRGKYLEKPVIYFIFSILFFSCYNGDKVPSKIIKPKDMGSIMWDVMRAQSLASEIALKDSTVDVAIKTKLLSQKVFEIHKTDSAQFNKSYNWYIKHPDILKRIFDSIYSQKQRENDLELKKNQIHHRPK
ncbi:MAG TPA: DUF4296 domain-containing protein [Hanamia sp.]|nr:DUF4296 domain-containing protein [Hanamia sp.]